MTPPKVGRNGLLARPMQTQCQIVRSVRPTCSVTREVFRRAGITVIEPDDETPRDEDTGANWFVSYPEDMAAVINLAQEKAMGFRFYFIQWNRVRWMDFAGTGAYGAPEIGTEPERRP